MEDFLHDRLPTVSIIIPLRNEEQYVGRCMHSVVNQEYPKELMEVLVVDGMSEDLSREIVWEYVQNHPFVRLLDNPARATTYGLNRGIKDAKGEVIARVDAHCSIERDYISSCVKALLESGAENVGGLMRPVGKTYLQKAIALAMCSRFGIGGGKFHYRDKEMFVDTVYLGAYRREVFEKIGLYDEEAHYGEDDELNYRLIRNGGKVLLSPRIKSQYYPRSSLLTLWKQYYRYGRGKVRTIRKHGSPASWMHLVPGIFVLSMIMSMLLYVVNPVYGWLIVGIMGSYFTSAIFVSARIGLRESWKYFPALLLVFSTMHFSYGIGFVVGAVRNSFEVIVGRKQRKTGRMHRNS